MKRTALEEKDILSPKEAVILYGMSRRRFKRLIKTGTELPFLTYYRTRKLIIRGEFERYLTQHSDLKITRVPKT